MYIWSRLFVSKCASQNLTTSVFFTFFAVMVSVVGLAHSASANGAGDTFLWKKSYGRDVGTIPSTKCTASQDKVGALCYDKCKEGWSVNPDNHLRCKPPGVASYDRGIGIKPESVTKCTASRDKVGALCYDKCKEGWSVNPDNHLRCKPPGVDSYDRGIGIAGIQCKSNREKKAGLCYVKPLDGYSCTLTTCTRNAKAYDRTAFKPVTNKYCKSNRNLEAGMCYENPRDGYSCSVTTCSRIKKGYDRKPFPSKSFCKNDKSLDAGLCYEKCRDGFKGVGPVCWAKLPDKWINCGAGGMATGMKFPKFLQGEKGKVKGLSAKANCGVIIAGQTQAPIMFAAAACAFAGNPGCAVFDDAEQEERAAMYRDDRADIMVQGENILNDLSEGFEKLADYLTKCGDSCTAIDVAAPIMDKIRISWKNLTTLQKIIVAKQVASGSNNLSNISRTTHKLPSEPPEKGLSTSETLLTIREVANLLQVVIALTIAFGEDIDPAVKDGLNLTSAALGMVSAFAFPTQGQQ